MDQLLQNYGSESPPSSPESSSSSITGKRKNLNENTNVAETERKKKKIEPVLKPSLPELPSFFLSELPIDPKQLQQVDEWGKVRSFPHVEGNYPSHIFIEFSKNFSSEEILETLSKVVTKSGKKEIGWSFIEQENANIQGNLDNVKLLHLIDDPHISLSRPFVLRRHQIEPFADLLKTNLKGKFNPFNVLFSEYEWFANDDRTRSFLSLAVSSGSNAIIQLITIVNDCLKEFELPPFYENPKPHASLCWTSGDIFPSLNFTQGQIEESFLCEITCIQFKSGNFQFRIF